MTRVLTVVLVISLLLVIGYSQFANPVVGEREAIDMGIKSVKATRSISTEEELILRVQLAILDHIAKHSAPPSNLNELVPTYFDSIPMDPTTKKPLEYEKSGTSYKLGAQVRAESAVASATGIAGATGTDSKKPENFDHLFSKEEMADGFVNPNTLVAEEFVYDTKGKRDPFRPFDESDGKTDKSGLPPLQRVALNQLRCTVIIAGPSGDYSAMVEDQSGRGYMVKKGTLIRDSNGSVAEIHANKIIVLETRKDLTGKEVQKVVEMPITKDSGADISKKDSTKKRRQ